MYSSAQTSVILMRRRWLSVWSPSSREVLAWLTLVTEVDVLESSFFWFWVNFNLRFWVAASGLVLMVMNCKRGYLGISHSCTLG